MSFVKIAVHGIARSAKGPDVKEITAHLPLKKKV